MMWSSLLQWFADRLPCRVIEGAQGPFLEKYLVFRTKPSKDAICLHLHHFLRSDEDPEPHDHPWLWAYSLVLSGGYTEEFLGSHDMLEERKLRPGAVNRITRDTRHRVVLEPGTTAWTLFLSGPVVKSWGFYRRANDGWRYIPWREFMFAKGLEPTPRSGSMLKPRVV